MMNMDYDNSRRPNTGRYTSQPNRRSGQKKGRYLKVEPKPGRKHSYSRRRRRLNPRFVILVAGLVALVLGITLGVRSCSKPSIIGRWDLDGTTIYRFEKDGKGALELMLVEYEFSYKIEDGILKIDFVDELALDANYTFDVSKKVLFLTGGPGDAQVDYALKRIS